MKIELLLAEIAECKACDLCSIPIAPEIKLSADLMVIAEQPSVEESNLQSSWFDRHSRYVSKLIGEIFDNNRVYYTYLIKCNTDKNLGKRNTATCFDKFLHWEISIMRPKMVLYMGGLFTKLYHYSIGDIAKSDLYRMAFWHSPQFVLNAGTKHINKFACLLKKIKEVTNVCKIA